jgi:hypothetical protein
MAQIPYCSCRALLQFGREMDAAYMDIKQNEIVREKNGILEC